MNSTLTWRSAWRSGAPPAAAFSASSRLAQRRQRGIDERVAEVRPLRLEAGDGGFDLSLFGRHVGSAVDRSKDARGGGARTMKKRVQA